MGQDESNLNPSSPSAQLERAIRSEDVEAIRMILQETNKDLLNKYCIGTLWGQNQSTPLGLAMWENKFQSADFISSIPGVDLSRGEKDSRTSPMWLALMRGNFEAARIIGRKGADCTKTEKLELGKRYTDFIESRQDEPAQTRSEQLALKRSKLATLKAKKEAENDSLREELFGNIQRAPQASTLPVTDPARAELFGTRGGNTQSTSQGTSREAETDPVRAELFGTRGKGNGEPNPTDPPAVSMAQTILAKEKQLRLLSVELLQEQEENVNLKKENSLLLEEKQKAEEERTAFMRAQQAKDAQHEKELRELRQQLEALKGVKQEAERLQFVEKALFLSRNIKFQKIHNFQPYKMLGTRNEIGFLCKLLLKDELFPVILKMIPNFTDMAPNCHRGANENELMILHRLNASHPNIINLLSEFVAEPPDEMVEFALASGRQLGRGRRIFVATEWHPRTLEEKLGQLGHEIRLEQVVRYCLEIVECFLFLFNNHIAHRNVTLSNLYVSEDDRIVLGEFGESVECDNLHRCQMKCLRGGNAVFTAPEVLKAIEAARNKKEAWIDFGGQYSWEVGCLMFCVCFGRFPFPGYPRTPANPSNVGPVVFPGGKGIPEELKQLMAGLLTAKKKRKNGN